MSKCPNRQSENNTDYLHGDTMEYAFTICHDCDEEYEDESQMEDEE